MALRNLSTPELVSVCLGLIEGPNQSLLREHGGVPEDLFVRVRAMVGRLLPHHTPAENSSEAQNLVNTLTARLTAADLHHDRKLRGIFTLLSALAELCDEEADRTALLGLRDAIFPRGLSAITRTYAEQIGAAEQAAHALTPAQRATLESIPALPATANLATAFDAYVSAARTLRSLENDRSEAQRAVSAPSPSAATRHDDRNAAIRLINTLINVVSLDGEVHPEVRRVFLDPLAALEATADARHTLPVAVESAKPAPVPVA
jgi:hypothetical protein